MPKIVSIASVDRAAILAKRDKLIEEHVYLVPPIAKNVARRLPPSFELDDLIASGHVGLVQAASRYNPRMKTAKASKCKVMPFPAFAKPRIRGEILESVRRRNWDENTMPAIDEGVRGPAAVIELKIDQAGMHYKLQAAVSELPPRLKNVIEMYYSRDEPTLAEVGAKLAKPVSRYRTKQLHAEALTALRVWLKRRAA